MCNKIRQYLGFLAIIYHFIYGFFTLMMMIDFAEVIAQNSKRKVGNNLTSKYLNLKFMNEKAEYHCNFSPSSDSNMIYTPHAFKKSDSSSQ